MSTSRRHAPVVAPSIADTDAQATDDLLVALGDHSIVPRSWRPDGAGILPDGVVGGDGAGEAVSVRYLNRYLPTARITTYFYVVDAVARGIQTDDTDDLAFFVEQMVESYIADRPLPDEEENEVWSDYQYEAFDRMYATEREAAVERDRLAAEDHHDFYTWSGTTLW